MKGWASAQAGMAALALSFLVGCGTLSAQVFDLSGGSSTAYDAHGGSLAIHGEHSETDFGAGWERGHFEAGGESVRRFGERTLAMGMQQMRMDLPTDIFDTEHVFAGTGVGFRSTTEGRDGVSVFGGFAAEEGGTPLFHATVLRTPSGVLRFQKSVTKHCFLMTSAVMSHTSSALQALGCAPSVRWHFAATGGFGGGSPYLAGSAKFSGRRLKLRAAYIVSGEAFSRSIDQDQPLPEPVGLNASGSYQLTRNLQLGALHQSFRTTLNTTGAGATGFQQLVGPRPPEASDVNEASVNYLRPDLSMAATVLRSGYREGAGTGSSAESGHSVGITLATERDWSRFRLSETLLESRSDGTGWNSILVNALGVRFNAHLLLEETLNLTGTHVSFAQGGELATTFGSARVEYQMFYVATRTGNPFEQAMIFNARVHLFHRLDAEAESSVNPLGKTVYTFRLGTQYARNGKAGAVPVKSLAGSLGQYELRGRVVEAPNTPVEGAVVQLGEQRLYTDSHGRFSLRESRPRSHPVHVLTDEFLTAGHYVAVRVPAVMVSTREEAEEVEIVVARRATPLPTAAAEAGTAEAAAPGMHP